MRFFLNELAKEVKKIFPVPSMSPGGTEGTLMVLV
jgi:hypothetical protein